MERQSAAGRRPSDWSEEIAAWALEAAFWRRDAADTACRETRQLPAAVGKRKGYYSGSKEFMAESFMAESFFKSLEGDSSLVGLSACGYAQTGVDPMTFSNSEMILP
ncbi:MAG: hypothetical protein NTW21_39710 [Verrucomicrobia bacterium]|nr:hypothetical protein [Verrucomicrobiota bacterium]